MIMIEESLNIAIANNATDIHLCPTSTNFLVKYRVAGKVAVLHKEQVSKNALNRLKMLSNLDLSETRRAQEGQFSFMFEQSEYFIRISIINTKLGEKIALRILPSGFNHSLQSINLPPHIQKKLMQSLEKPKGIIFVCGATGAGKTTTLYSCLEHLNNGEKTIFTIEDPVEFTIKDFYQCELNSQIHITPQYILKSLLRQDPDVIFIGELRDKETADLALMAAHTGHLVLTTIHTNSALELFYRLQGWNIDMFTLVSSLNFVIHQKMTYQNNRRVPYFTGIAPSWGNNLPKDYQSLINDVANWDHYDETTK
ncbi:GspE/PulE family protein [Marinomonas algicola]|uniref:GspE/PulE family protein n=1 Tax=Marinomonas algicola TaxID=2773454 RepID=UPI001EFF3000|nr:ATPase, T2SS/T4P/T4SS family [Marinomonas algicola]